MSSKRKSGSVLAALRVVGRAALRPGRAAAFGALALSVLISCILDGDKTAKRGSEVENEIHGVLVAVDGDPVQGAKVKAVPAAGQIAKRGAASADSDSVLTDEDGKYSLKGLEPGTYNLFGDYQTGDLVVLIPGVDHSDTTEPKDQGVDTLRAPGRIHGRLLLGDQGKEGVLAYVPGTSYLAVSDDSGRFVIAGVPQGTHRVSYSAAGFVIAPDTGVEVLSGKVTELPTKTLEHDPALPPPPPVGLKAVYDTLNERVSLTWNSVPVSDLEGYVIYRDGPVFHDPQLVPGGFTKGIAFLDSVSGAPPGMERRTATYRVKSRDREANLSINYSQPVDVEVMSRLWVTTRIDLEVLGAPHGRASIGDSLFVVARYSNPTRLNRRVEWSRDGHPEHLRITEDSALSGADTLAWVADSAGVRIGIRVEVWDQAGTAWRANLALDVVEDIPTATAGPDTIVSVGDTVRLRGTGSDSLGRIVKREWDIGATGVFRESGADTVITAPSVPIPGFACVFRVTDDDGRTAEDTAFVVVLEDRPRVTSGPDTVVTIKDTLRLRAEAVDGFGSIRRWEWRCGGEEFRAGGPAAEHIVPDAPVDELACIVRVTDDDGMTAQDTLYAQVLLDAPEAVLEVDAESAVLEGDTVRCAGIRSRDGRGRIARMELAVGEGPFQEIPDGDSVVVAPHLTVKMLKIFLRVMDDDGNTDLDSVALAYMPQRRWVESPEKSPLGPRIQTQGAWFKGSYWLIGGMGKDDGYHDDIWISPDGKTWTQVAAGPRFSPRSAVSLLIFRDKLWLLGGRSNLDADGTQGCEIWSTQDGSAWNLETDHPGFCRAEFGAAVYKDKMYVTGGMDYRDWSMKADVWSSADGILWQQVRDTAEFGNAWSHSIAVFKDSLWLVSQDRLWKSGDGGTWEHVVAESPPSLDFGTGLAVFDGELWAITQNGCYRTLNGKAWVPVPGPPQIRRYPALFGNGEELLLIGGSQNGGTFQFFDDVWMVE